MCMFIGRVYSQDADFIVHDVKLILCDGRVCIYILLMEVQFKMWVYTYLIGCYLINVTCMHVAR